MRYLFAAFFLSITVSPCFGIWPWSKDFDLPALAKAARPATLQVLVFDSAGDQIATGTGFLITPDGIVVTNGHVISNATSVTLKSENGQIFSVSGVVDFSAENDIALLRMKGDHLIALPLGSTSKVSIGERVAVIGSPLGLEGTVSDGVISAIRQGKAGHQWIQITAAISPGSSGSPVINSEGLVIGVATMRLLDGQSLNFAVPVEAVKALSLNAKLLSIDAAALELRDGSAMKDPSYKEYNDAFHADDWNGAHKALKNILSSYPKWAFGYSELGFTLYMLDRNQEALVAGKRSVELNPNDPGAWEMVGLAFQKLRKNEEAIAAFKQAAHLNPNSYEAWSNLCDIYVEIADKVNAAAAFKRMQEITRERKQRGNERTIPKSGF